ncbi:MAG: hypothetical protein K9H14_04165 [Actinomycetia bacterium]|nr:hypothetical protein [Actinomycetes bacterium]
MKLRMTMGNWIFWSVLVWIGVMFLWMGIFPEISAWFGFIIATILAAIVFKFGPRPKYEEDEEE